jgi:hypothetical protein
MWNPRLRRGMLPGAVLAVCATGAIASQAQSTPPADPIVTELRALRAELKERLDGAITAQLLVARLQLQEQRANNVIRQLQDVDTRLRENQSTREQLSASIKMFSGLAKESYSTEEKPNPMFAPLRAGLERTAQTEAELKQQQIDLQGMVAEEQARWSVLNARLDELERLLAKPVR